MKVNSYKDLTVWQRSVELVVKVYLVTKKFPKQEKFGIISQMRRAAISIPSNIAEGFGRVSKQSYIQFLQIANASAAELETQLIISERRGYIHRLDNSKTNGLLLGVL